MLFPTLSNIVVHMMDEGKVTEPTGTECNISHNGPLVGGMIVSGKRGLD